MSYADRFRRKIIDTQDLLQPGVMESHLSSGFVWVRRRRSRHFDLITRTPSLGFTVELSVMYQPYAIPLSSAKAQRLIRRLGYFTADATF
jgi:hypothetical protein